jgi:hypothetical protein
VKIPENSRCLGGLSGGKTLRTRASRSMKPVRMIRDPQIITGARTKPAVCWRYSCVGPHEAASAHYIDGVHYHLCERCAMVVKSRSRANALRQSP